ncbi:MAG: phasin family protein [Hyphomicrobium sp.]|nr:phasin family protein [Hyphomicrobium sp.]
MTERHEEIEETTPFENNARNAMSAWMSLQLPMFSLMTELNGRLIHEAMKANSEFIALCGERIEHGLVCSQRMMRCRSVREMLDANAEFLRGHQERTRIEIRTISRINKSVADQTLAAVRSSIDDNDQAAMRH